MSMTLQEAAIKSCEDRIKHLESTPIHHYGKRQRERAIELERVKIAALRPITREQVEKMWTGCSWCNNEGKKPENWECSLLDDRGFSVVVGDEVVWTNAEFCPVCGKPLTDEAVGMVMERLNKMEEMEK